jgi:hypothetical protein
MVGPFWTFPPCRERSTRRDIRWAKSTIFRGMPLGYQMWSQRRQRIGTANSLRPAGAKGAILSCSTVVHRAIPFVLRKFRALPPHTRVRVRHDIRRRKLAIFRCVPFPSQCRIESYQRIGRRYAMAPAIGAPPSDRSFAHGNAPDMLDVFRALPPYPFRGSRHDVGGSQITILRRMPLLGQFRHTGRQRIGDGYTLMRAKWATPISC